MRWPIRYQLIVPLLILLLGVAGISTWTALASAHQARNQLETQVRNVAHTLSASRHVPLTNRIVLEQMKGLSGADYLLVAEPDTLLSTLPTAAEVPPPLGEVVEDWQTLHLGPRVLVADRAFLGGAIRLPPRADIPQGAILYILYPEERWRTALWQAVQPSLILGGFAGLASIGLAVGVGQRLSRRIAELERRTRFIAGGDFSPMPLPGRNDELRDLGRSVNEMAQQLAQLQEAVQKSERLRLLGQVSGGLAHQLRNGLSGVRLAVQLHARECPGPGDAEALRVALRQLVLLDTQLKRLLELGRGGPVRRERCSLREVAGEVLGLLRPRCRHAHIELRWSPPDHPGYVHGDRGQLEQMVLNVVGNAIEAAGLQGWVEIVLRHEAEQKQLVLEVSDSGPGPPPEVSPRLFEPFVTGKPEGVGLGLAVARQVAEAHRGRIAWHHDERGTCFRIEIPEYETDPDRR